MFDVGFSELVLLFVIGLLILGPERLPRVASQIGRWVGRARRTATQLRMQLEREMTMSEIMEKKRKTEREKPDQPTEPTETRSGTDDAVAGDDSASAVLPKEVGDAARESVEPEPTIANNDSDKH
jgi:sec-independent protein translocase protein TatB